MTSIVNLFSNLNDLTKPKSLTLDNIREYKENIHTRHEESPSLNQGEKFKKYQEKIKTNLEENIEKYNLVEGFEGILSKQTDAVINKNDFTREERTLNNLKREYEKTLQEYNTSLENLNTSSRGYIDRVNPNNIYLDKVIEFNNGQLSYVTMKGVAKWIRDRNSFNKMFQDRGVAQKSIVKVNLPWSTNYQSPGTTIPTRPPLISGTPVKIGESLGNEGSNVFVDSFVKNPRSSFIGCYNNIPPITETMFVPTMNASNSVNGYTSSASSIYQNNNNFTGPWNAFDKNVNTFWHSSVNNENLYNSNTGQYIGNSQMTFANSSGVQTTVKGEFLGISRTSPVPLTRYEILGRQNCCGQPNGRDPNTWYILGLNNGSWYQVDYRTNISFNFKLLSFTVSNPTPYSAYRIITTVVGDNRAPAGSRNSLQIATWNLYSSSNYVSSPNSAMTDVGKMNFAQCQKFALNSGNKYFGLQAVDNNGAGNCMVSNDLAGSQINGQAVRYQTTALWDSRTYGNNPGSTMSFSNGSISVLNSSSASVFSTPNTSTQPPTYIGCYGDRSSRAMDAHDGGRQAYNNSTCKQAAERIGAQYYGLQNSRTGENAQCFTSSDLIKTKKYGVANNCTRIADGSSSGGGWSNAVYRTSNPSTSYFLILQDDGNLCIYKGTGPSDNQGIIWSSRTTGKKQQPNPNFAAPKGKYGKSWITSGSTLAQGDFIGSTDGSTYLIMQSDGNLVLYTSTSSSKCASSPNSGNAVVGAQDANALHQVVEMGNKNSIGKLAYIDEDSKLHSYPSDNTKYSNSYTLYTGLDSAGYDIPGASSGNSSVEKCKTSCNSNNLCAGFTISNNVCYPKTSRMFPNGSVQINKNINLYTRNKSPITPPVGVPGTVINIDSIEYNKYTDGGSLDRSYGLTNVTNSQQQNLSRMLGKLNSLTSKINDYTDMFDSGNNSLNEQSDKNLKGLGDYLKDYKNINNNITNFDKTNIENVLDDSDITVLQKNYDYLFWSILATGTVLVTMNIVKKNIN